MHYTRICVGLNDKGTLVPSTDVADYIKDHNKDHYASLFEYNELHYKHFLEHNSIAGIIDVTTSKLAFDFDCVDDLEKAREEALEIRDRLLAFGISDSSLQFYFSGKKGFTVIVETDLKITPAQLRKMCIEQIGKGLSTLDKSLYNASRILRVPWTAHQESGLYKLPISLSTLQNSSIEQIRKLAEKIDNGFEIEYSLASLPPSKLPEIKEDNKIRESIDAKFLDFTIKPKFLTNCRWALQNGRFHEGARNSALMVLGATYKNLGFTLEHTYRLLKGVCELQAQYTKTERFSDNDLYNMVISQVYGDAWRGGQYTCRHPGNFLYDYCQTLGIHKCIHNNKDLTVRVKDVFGLFQDYTQNYENNILYTGIPPLDEQCKFMVGTSNSIVGPPGAGKTSLMLELLNYNSNQGIPSIFFSYDMFHAAVSMRMIQKHTGLSQEKIYDIMKNNPKKKEEIEQMLYREYKNVEFCFKTGQTPDEIVETIKVTQEKLDKKIKLVVIDYNELVTASVSDPTAASAEVAQKLRQIANEHEVCIITLLQPAKMYSSPQDAVTTFNAAKGSSAIPQSMTLMLGISRPGANVYHPELDRFFNITCLKNRNGAQFSLDFSWDGLTGTIGPLHDHDLDILKELREKRDKDREDRRGW